MKWISQQLKVSMKAFCGKVSSVLEFINILNCCDTDFTYILFHMTNLLNRNH